ncbi:MAG: hypothetical protein KDB24_15255, partial [Microthrixaceae bacterium]|nr:hypothetical protein [Microthrixaceae bacterium]
SSAVTRPSSSSVLAARPLVPAGGGSAAPRAADVDVANQRPDAAEAESGSDDLIDRASSATVLKPRPLTPV